jgi:hypothetical protein
MNGMKAVRRAHMYAGLALAPFVALYGITAILFNHPGIGSETRVRHLPADVAAFDPGAADRHALHAVSQVDCVAIDEDVPARFTGRTMLVAEGRTLLVDEDGARLILRPASTGEPEVFEGIEALEDHRADLLASARAVDPEAAWRIRSIARLEFGVWLDGERRAATYDPLRETLTLSEPRARSLRSRLTALHKAHTYPTGVGADLWWAILVDVLGAMMVLWAISGVAMWWQMKRLRRGGLAALAISAVATAVLVVSKSM